MIIVKRIIIWFSVVVIVVLVGVSVYFNSYGKKLILNTLNASLDRRIDFDRIIYYYPLNLVAHNVKVEGMLNSKVVVARLSPESFFNLISNKFLNRPIEISIDQLLIKEGRCSIQLSYGANNISVNSRNILYQKLL